MSWIQTFTGKKVDLLEPTAEMIDIEDIAQSLSMLCRYNGHVKQFYSVAEHSALMSELVSKDAQIYALLHDAAEAYVTDLPTPLKQVVGGFDALERGFKIAIYEHFNMSPPSIMVKMKVKDADMRMLVTERNQLLTNTPSNLWADWGVDIYEPYPIIIGAYAPSMAKKFFMNRFAELMA